MNHTSDNLITNFIDILSNGKIIDSSLVLNHNGSYCSLKVGGIHFDSNPDGDISICLSIRSTELKNKIEEITHSIYSHKKTI